MRKVSGQSSRVRVLPKLEVLCGIYGQNAVKIRRGDLMRFPRKLQYFRIRHDVPRRTISRDFEKDPGDADLCEPTWRIKRHYNWSTKLR